MALTRLHETLLLLYEWQDEEIEDFARDLLDRRVGIWHDELRALAFQYGCQNPTVRGPRGKYREKLRRDSRREARGIARTWSRHLRNEIERLFNRNPRGNRQYYISNLERWAERRMAWKNLQIGLATEQNTAWYAQQSFRQENNVRDERFIYIGPAPVGPVCIRRFGEGIVDREYIEREPTPAHPNCPHRWQVVNPEQIGCQGMWLG